MKWKHVFILGKFCTLHKTNKNKNFLHFRFSFIIRCSNNCQIWPCHWCHLLWGFSNKKLMDYLNFFFSFSRLLTCRAGVAWRRWRWNVCQDARRTLSVLVYHWRFIQQTNNMIINNINIKYNMTIIDFMFRVMIGIVILPHWQLWTLQSQEQSPTWWYPSPCSPRPTSTASTWPTTMLECSDMFLTLLHHLPLILVVPSLDTSLQAFQCKN